MILSEAYMKREEGAMLKFLSFLLPKSVNVTPRPPRTMEGVGAALSPSPELDEQVRAERGRFAEEVVKMERTAADIHMALSRATLDFRARRN